MRCGSNPKFRPRSNEKIGYKTKAAAAAEATAKMEKSPLAGTMRGSFAASSGRQESVTTRTSPTGSVPACRRQSTYEPKQVLLQRLFSEVMRRCADDLAGVGSPIGKSQGTEFELKMNGRKDGPRRRSSRIRACTRTSSNWIVEAQFFNHSLIEFDYDPARNGRGRPRAA